jgi:hypothetical protein
MPIPGTLSRGDRARDGSYILSTKLISSSTLAAISFARTLQRQREYIAPRS